MKGAYKGLKEFLGERLIQIAEENNYSLDNILILKSDIEKLKNEYPETYKNIYSCRHNRDRRSAERYAQDLVASWVLEDYVISMITDNDLKLKLSGADKNRKILPNTSVRSDSDYIALYKGEEVNIELACDYSNYWKIKKKIDLRDKKYQKLVDSQSLLLGISILSKNFFIADFRKPIKAQYISCHSPFGGKPAYSIDFKEAGIKFHDLNDENIIKEIKRTI